MLWARIMLAGLSFQDVGEDTRSGNTIYCGRTAQVPTMRYSGNAPGSHCRGLGLVPGQSVRMCEDKTSLQNVFRRVFRFSTTGTGKTPTMLRTRSHRYRYTSQKDEQTKPGGTIQPKLCSFRNTNLSL